MCQGHIAKDCPDHVKADFLDYVARLLKSGLFRTELFGTWIDSLNKYHPDYNRPNPQDLRQHLVYNQRGVPHQDLRRSIGYSSAADLRTRIGHNPQGQIEPQHSQDHHDYQEHYQPRGPHQEQYQPRGSYRGNNNYRGRGRPRARGYNRYRQYY